MRGTTSLPTTTDVINDFEYSTAGMLQNKWRMRMRLSFNAIECEILRAFQEIPLNYVQCKQFSDSP